MTPILPTMESTKPAFINSLPDEVLQQIIYFLSPDDVLRNVHATSKRLHVLADSPLLWRHHCKVEFKYWDAPWAIRSKYQDSVGETAWKDLYLARRKIDLHTTAKLNSILGEQTNRIANFEAIAKFGYDAKDTLLRHREADIDVDDGLARRYYADSVLDHIHRAKAIKTWHAIFTASRERREDYFADMSTQPRDDISLENALCAFDLFIIHDQKGDYDDISDMLDGLCDLFRSETPKLGELSTSQKAFELVKFLRRHDLTGLQSETGYRDLENNYISMALQNESHPSLPLVSVSIFCAIGRRIGIDARVCGIPTHVHAMVHSPPGQALDGKPLVEGQNQSKVMYLDPYRSTEEVLAEDIRIMLGQWGIRKEQYSDYTRSIAVSSVVLRTARNILATVHEFRNQAHGANDDGPPSIRLYGNPFADLDSAFYSALWANFIFGNVQGVPMAEPQSRFIPILLERFQRLFPMDASLLETYIVPQYNTPGDPVSDNLAYVLRAYREADCQPKEPRVREPGQEAVHRIGQVFTHRRYGYTAAIVGWDMDCNQREDWIIQYNVDSLARGRHQNFYHAFVDDNTIRYVAHENIEILDDLEEIPASLKGMAGRFFKRWDSEKKCFVSNIKDQYPED